MIFNAMNLKVNEVQKAILNLFSLNNFVLAPHFLMNFNLCNKIYLFLNIGKRIFLSLKNDFIVKYYLQKKVIVFV